MKSLILLWVLTVIVLPILTPAVYADTLIYNNSGWQGGSYLPQNADNNEEFLDYGSSSGGLVSKFEIGYATTESNPGTLYVRFWQGTNRWNRGNLIKTITLTDLDGFSNYIEYTIPEEDRFELAPGNFGYSYEFSWSYNESGPLLASGGSSNENYLWIYYINEWYDQQQVSGGYAGLYMKVYTGPALADITCDITGSKFDDTDGDGVWDAGEPGLSGWEIYIDENGDGNYQASEPNVITDPNGMYLFENLLFADPNETKTFVIREVMQDGWTQTLPGGPDYEYTITAEPNNVYTGYDFGNTDQPVTKYGGGNGTVGNPYQIWTATHMNQIGANQEDWGSHFILMDDINMSGITGEQYNIIGYRISSEDYLYFTGTFDGNNYTIQNFSYTTSAETNTVGVFGYAENATITDLTLTNATISTAGTAVGALAGYQRTGTVSNCHVNASVTGTSYVGGLIGFSNDGVISQCSSTGTVMGTYQSGGLGGLVGILFKATVNDCYSHASVTGGAESGDVGGLSGYLSDGSLTDCYATGAVIAGDTSERVGGLLGIFQGTATLERCYSTGDVTSGENSGTVGGLIGYYFAGDISSSFSTGNVSSSSAQGVGGLIGIHSSGTVRHCYSTGNVTGDNLSDYVGGFAGGSFGEIFCSYSTGMVSAIPSGIFNGSFTGLSKGVVNCFWNSETSGLAYSGGGKPRTTAQMQQVSNYVNWNTPAETNWVIDEGVDFPHLIWEGTAGTNLPVLLITDYLDGQGTSSEPFLIQDANDLNVIGVFYDQWDSDYRLTSDIDMSVLGGSQFNMIGTENIPFTGSFDGDGYWIDHFTYSTTGTESYLGLFRFLGGTVSDVSLEDIVISVDSGGNIGGLVGFSMSSSAINNCYIQGQINVGDDSQGIGGMIGELEGVISDCDSEITITAVEAASYIGGLIGTAYGDGSVIRCSSMASINVGNDSGNIGGLLGDGGCLLSESFSIGTIAAGDNCQKLGGLSGEHVDQTNDITNCYSKVDLTSGNSCQEVGGLTGRLYGGADIYYCYSMGTVTCGESGQEIGGLIGVSGNGSYAYYSYWDIETSAQDTSATGTGRDTEQMLTQSSYESWDFNNTWRICDGMNYPRLQWEPKPVGDFVCPEGVEINDLVVLMDEWLAEVLSLTADMAPDGGDGKVTLTDWTRLASAWQTSTGQPGWDDLCDLAPETPDGTINELDLSVFADQWLYHSARYADIAPAGAPDGRVDLLDYALFAENWMLGVD